MKGLFKRLRIRNYFTDFKHHHDSWRRSKKRRAKAERRELKRMASREMEDES